MRDGRERDIVETFVSLATRLARGDDVVELVTELTEDCTRLLDVASVGLLLADRRGILHLLAASSERTRDLEAFQLQRDQGPCLDCYQTGAAVSCDNLIDEAPRWPQFSLAALEAGFRSAHALPLHLSGVTIGAIGLFKTSPGALDDQDRHLGQALADVASVSIVQDRAAIDRETLNQQLQRALDSRVVVEQAKGLLAQRGDLTMDAAFAHLKRYSRDRNERLSEIAQALATRELTPQQVLDHVRLKRDR